MNRAVTVMVADAEVVSTEVVDMENCCSDVSVVAPAGYIPTTAAMSATSMPADVKATSCLTRLLTVTCRCR